MREDEHHDGTNVTSSSSPCGFRDDPPQGAEFETRPRYCRLLGIALPPR
jgi:hypothetical protein